MPDEVEVAAQELAECDAVCFGSEAMDADEWAQVLNERSRVFKVYEGDKLAGIAVAKWDAGIGYLYSNAVYPEYRKQGIGTRLVNDRLSYLEGFCSIIQAHTRIGNEGSQATLRKCGFSPIQYVTDFYGDFEDAILWRRER